MNKAYLLTGGNMGERESFLAKAKTLLSEQCGAITGNSSLYETAAWGNTTQAPFLNQALELSTTLNARQLIRRILKIEKLIGRIRAEKFGPRVIDIDILLFNNQTVDLPFLKIPHPEMQNRRFVLMPLNELASNVIHPVLKKSIAQLLNDCADPLEVKKYS